MHSNFFLTSDDCPRKRSRLPTHDHTASETGKVFFDPIENQSVGLQDGRNGVSLAGANLGGDDPFGRQQRRESSS